MKGNTVWSVCQTKTNVKAMTVLHAVDRKKTRYYLRYVGHRDGSEKQVKEEDEITSTVLGPLTFFDATTTYEFWRDLIRLHSQSSFFPAEPPISAELSLWPVINGVEPDAHAVFSWAGGNRLEILIEIKWHARLSGHDQLHKQWQRCIENGIKPNAWHIFIAPEISDGIAARQSDNVWQIDGEERLILLSWVQIRDVLSKYIGTDSLISRWALLADRFLEVIGVQRFEGFDKASCALQDIDATHYAFFRGLTHGFAGFLTSAESLPVSDVVLKSFFRG